jgi:hypothetical protein
MRVGILALLLTVTLVGCSQPEEGNTSDGTGPTVPGGLPPGCFTETGTRVNAGAQACRGGKVHECQTNGEWVNLGRKC